MSIPPLPVQVLNGDGSPSNFGGAGTGLPASLGQKTAAASTSVVLASGDVLTNRSGTITTGGTAQSLAASNANRRYLLVQNPTTGSESFWISLITTAVVGSPSVEIAPGATLTFDGAFVPTGAVSVIAATTGTPFTGVEG